MVAFGGMLGGDIDPRDTDESPLGLCAICRHWQKHGNCDLNPGHEFIEECEYDFETHRGFIHIKAGIPSDLVALGRFAEQYVQMKRECGGEYGYECRYCGFRPCIDFMQELDNLVESIRAISNA